MVKKSIIFPFYVCFLYISSCTPGGETHLGQPPGVGSSTSSTPSGSPPPSSPSIAPEDRDGDGIADLADKCPGNRNPLGLDADGDGIPDACDRCTSLENVEYQAKVTVSENCRATDEGYSTSNGQGIRITQSIPNDTNAVLDASIGRDCNATRGRTFVVPLANKIDIRASSGPMDAIWICSITDNPNNLDNRCGVGQIIEFIIEPISWSLEEISASPKPVFSFTRLPDSNALARIENIELPQCMNE